MLQTITTKPGDKYRSLRNPKVYEALRRQGYSKGQAARISNAQARKRRHKALQEALHHLPYDNDGADQRDPKQQFKDKAVHTFTIAQLEAFVSSPAYDPAIAQAIAARVPQIPSLKGEQIAPGITRIRGNLCNVHGKYGPCDKALSGKKPKGGKGRAAKPRKPIKTPEQRAQERQQQRQASFDKVAQQMADNDAGLSPSGAKALGAFAQGQQPDARMGDGLARLGLAERAESGGYRLTPTGRAAVSAMQAGDYQRAIDTISRGTDASSARQARQTAQAGRQQAAAARRSDAEAKRQQRAAERAKRQADKPKAGSGGGKKKPAAQAQPIKRQPIKMPTRSGAAPSPGGVSGASRKPIAQAAPKPEKPAAPAKQETTPQLAETARSLSDGKELSDDDQQALIRNGLARLNKDGELILTAAGQRAVRQQTTKDERRKTKDYSQSLGEFENNPSLLSGFAVFKDARGAWRWVAQSSTAYQDRDREIVSTKALTDDCAYADETGSYGVLRWWHSPGLDLGDCDFNAMHGRVLIESGTFRSEAIAQKVAAAADGLEISLGFLHPPFEPDAHGVFHHIRRFERSLVPRGKASNRFTAFAVKEQPRMDATKIAGLKAIGFGDDEIADILSRADKTEKAAADEGVAFKADEPTIDLPDIIVNGVTYKAAPFPPKDDSATPPADAEADAVIEEDAIEPMDEPDDGDPTALTLSQGDLAAIAEAIGPAIQQAVATIMGGLDLEKKVAGHVQGLMTPYQATKDAEQAQTREQVEALTAKVKELSGDAPAVPYRASQARDNVLTDAALVAATKQIQQGAGPFDDIIRGLGLGQS